MSVSLISIGVNLVDACQVAEALTTSVKVRQPEGSLRGISDGI